MPSRADRAASSYSPAPHSRCDLVDHQLDDRVVGADLLARSRRACASSRNASLSRSAARLRPASIIARLASAFASESRRRARAGEPQRVLRPAPVLRAAVVAAVVRPTASSSVVRAVVGVLGAPGSAPGPGRLMIAGWPRSLRNEKPPPEQQRAPAPARWSSSSCGSASSMNARPRCVLPGVAGGRRPPLRAPARGRRRSASAASGTWSHSSRTRSRSISRSACATAFDACTDACHDPISAHVVLCAEYQWCAFSMSARPSRDEGGVGVDRLARTGCARRSARRAAGPRARPPGSARA